MNRKVPFGGGRSLYRRMVFLWLFAFAAFAAASLKPVSTLAGAYPGIQESQIPRDWVGEYDGTDGVPAAPVRRKLSLHFGRVNEDGTAVGVAVVSPLSEGAAPFGRYRFGAAFDLAGGTFTLQGYAWEEQADDAFGFVRLSGRLSEDLSSMEGTTAYGSWELKAAEVADEGTGGERRTGEAAYGSSQIDGDTHTGVVRYTDSLFLAPSDAFNLGLARTSLSLAMAAFQSSGSEEFLEKPEADSYTFHQLDPARGLEHTPAKNVVNLLAEWGFERIRVNQDYLVTTRFSPGLNDGNNIALALGQKELDPDTVLLAVALRGGGYGDEWIGNFTFAGSGKEHLGFSLAKERALEAMESYVTTQVSEGKRLKVWITGYSRSAAVSNLVAGYLCSHRLAGREVDPSDVYAYTFATPMSTKEGYAREERYGGIWNILCQEDMVPLVPAAEWGYRRYGNDLVLPSMHEKTPGAYKAFAGEMYQRFQELTATVSLGEGMDVLQEVEAGEQMDGTGEGTVEKGTTGGEFPSFFIKPQQETIRDLVSLLAGAVGEDDSDMAYRVQGLLQEYFKEGSRQGYATRGEGMREAVSVLLETLSNPEILLQAEENLRILTRARDCLTGIAYAHHPLLYAAWLEVLPEEYFTVQVGRSQEEGERSDSQDTSMKDSHAEKRRRSLESRFGSLLRLNKTETTIYLGGTSVYDRVQLQVETAYGLVVFTSSDPSVATVTNLGLVVAKKEGKAVITASLLGLPFIKAECEVTVERL